MKLSALALLFFFALFVGGCDEETQDPGLNTIELTPVLKDDTVVTGGALELSVRGGELLVPERIEVTLHGELATSPPTLIQETFEADYATLATSLDISLPWALLESYLPTTEQTRFNGDIHVDIEDIASNVRGVGTIEDARIIFARSLIPQIDLPDTSSVHLNETLAYSSSSLLLPSEGKTEILMTGSFQGSGGIRKDINQRIPVAVGANRTRASIHVDPAWFGLHPGTFTGSLSVENQHDEGRTVLGTQKFLTMRLLPTSIGSFDPPAASRGQIMQIVGQGFIPPDSANAQTMYFNFEGSFFPLAGGEVEYTGPRALRLVPDDIPNYTEARLILRTETEQERFEAPTLIGLSAQPGTFSGTLTPVLIRNSETVLGEPWFGEFSIAPTRQIIFVKFLPGFSEALDKYGLRNVETEIRTRIFEVTARDYQGINIEFTDTRPEIFAEYSIIEIGGSDPNGAGLFGLDNTAGKDTGNIRLDDVIGGENAESGELGYYVYGGVFLNSFVLFSASLSQDDLYASPWFDTLFGPFMPDLGGTPVSASEWPEGPRAPQVDEAIRVMGNLIGNTISHEIGHSLGLTFFPEDLDGPSSRFHNEFDEPNALMDSGFDRPFEERIEVDGQGPAAFTQENRAYLETVLPLR